MAIQFSPIKLTFDETNARSRLMARLQLAQEAARSRNDSVIACATIFADVSIMWCEPTAMMFNDTISWYWREPGANGHTFVAVDATILANSRAANRFDNMREAYEDSRARIVSTSLDQPRWFAGFAFAPAGRREPWMDWPSAMLILPTYLFDVSPVGDVVVTICVEVTAESSVQSVADVVIKRLRTIADTDMNSDSKLPARLRMRPADADVEPHTVPTGETHWRSRVENAAAQIRSGAYSKMVLARQDVLPKSGMHVAVHALRRLRTAYPDNTGFSVSFGDEAFVGATPERLLHFRDGRIVVDCLAGTTARGQNAAEDETLALSLQESSKNRQEHAVVVHWMANALADVATDIVAPVNPVIRKLPNVQHLYTPIEAQAMPDVTLLDLVEHLHPTPAVAGDPRDVAMEAIRTSEPFDRGWYAGPIGWLGMHGEGEFVVSLRSALLRRHEAVLYAGCGIMGDSDPASEWTETELKLRPMRMALRVN